MSISLQKANFWKRISAYLFDFIIAAIITVGAASGISALLGYDKYSEQLTGYYTQYLEKEGIEEYIDITQEEYEKLSEEEQAKLQAAEEAYANDAEVIRIYNIQFYMSLVIVGGSLLFSHLILYFAVPLFFGNGQTLGKKIFGIAVIRSNCVKASNPVLFIRAIFGQFTIETMFPALIITMIAFNVLGLIGTITLGLFLILQIGVMIYTKTNSAIHDLLADTVVVDLASQEIFQTEEELIAYKQKQAEEEAAKQSYM